MHISLMCLSWTLKCICTREILKCICVIFENIIVGDGMVGLVMFEYVDNAYYWKSTCTHLCLVVGRLQQQRAVSSAGWWQLCMVILPLGDGRNPGKFGCHLHCVRPHYTEAPQYRACTYLLTDGVLCVKNREEMQEGGWGAIRCWGPRRRRRKRSQKNYKLLPAVQLQI